MMAKRSQKVPELREKTELKCKWGLFSIFESCQGRRVSRKLISNGRRLVNQQITEYPRKSEQLTRFDEECQRFQSEVDLASVTKSTSGLNVIQEKECSKVESELADHLMESQRKITRKPTHHHKPLASKEMPPSKITFAEVLRTASPRHNDNLAAEPEDLVRSYSARMYDSNLDEIHMHRVQMGAKALVDRMFIERRLKDQLDSGSKSFSKALEALSSTKNLRSYKNDKEPFKGRPEEDSLRKSSFVAPPNDEIVVLKPKLQSPKYSENVSCHCSSMQYHHKSSVTVRESDSFSFKKMKKRLKHRLKGPNGPGPFLTCGDSYVLPQNGWLSASETGNDLQNTKSCVDPKTKDKLWKRPDLKHKAGSDFSSEDRKKLDFDVILEAKRHLSSRLESLSAFDTDATCKKKPLRTLGRVLLSPERDFKTLSPKRESEIFSGSAQLRCSVYNSPPQVSNISFMKQIERQRTCLSPSRSTIEVLDREEEMESSFLIPSTGEESLHNTVKSKDDPKVVMTETTPRQESNGSEAACMIVSQNEDDNTIEHSISGSVSENEASTSTSSTIIHPLDITDAVKYQEEHQSPVSVLEPVFTEEENSPPSIMSPTDKQTLQPCRLDFEGQSSPRDEFIIEHCCIEDLDRITQYVQLVLQASRLNWDRLSAIESLPEETEIVSESLFDELDFPLTDDHCCFEPKLLFDHINEVLLDLYEVYCCSLPRAVGLKRLPRIRQVALDKLVIDKVMNEAEFYTLPRTERRTLDQLVSKYVRNCRSWLDVRSDTEQIVTEISDDVLEESILDILVGIQS